MSPPDLDNHQRKTLERLTGHPLPTNLKVPQVVSLLEAMGEVTVESGDRYRVTVGGRTEVFRLPAHREPTRDTLVALRHFLSQSPVADQAPSPGPAAGEHLVAVIDRRRTTIYRFEGPSERVATITPYDPKGHLRHLHYIEGAFEHQREPDETPYFRSVVAALRDADTVVLIGHGDGHSEAVRLIGDRLTAERSTPAPRIIGVRLDTKSYTEPQLLAIARQTYEGIAEAGGPG